MVVLTKGQKRALESSSDDQAVLKKIKLVAWDSEDKEQFKKDYEGSCWNFAETGECTFAEECRFNHVKRDGELVQEAKVKTKTKKKKTKKKKTKKKKSKKKTQNKVIRKTKEECIAEREIDEDDNIYTGTVKFFKKGYGFISIEEDITFKNLTATKKIYVMKEDIICESDEIGLNMDEKVMFKVYKDSMGLGAMDVLNEDGSPIVFVLEAIEGEKTEKEEVVEKEPTPEPVKPKKTLTKKKSSKPAKKKKAVKKTTKRKSTKSKKN